MKKSGKKMWLRIFFLLVFGIMTGLFSSIQAEAEDGFTIRNYRVDMKVSKNHVYQITETILVDFYESRHGIYRNIPTRNRIRRADGSTGTTYARVERIDCSHPFSKSMEEDVCKIKIGDKDKRVTGQITYTLSYDYVMGNDILDGNDEFYFNIIGTEWTTSIENVSFSIEMPDSFDENNLGMTYGPVGEEHMNGLTYAIEGNRIEGKLDPSIKLNPYEGVTVRLLLPEGYFEKTWGIPWSVGATFILGIIGILLAFVLWWRVGRDDVVVSTIEYYPPDDMSPLEVAFAYRGELQDNDAVSLVVTLAQKGYIQIMGGDSKKDFALMRKKLYDGTDSCESVFMQGLFALGEVVGKRQLENKFYKTIKLIKGIVNTKENKEQIFYANSLNKGWILWGISFVLYILSALIPMLFYSSFSQSIYMVFFSSILFLAGFKNLFDPAKTLKNRIRGALGMFVLGGGMFYFTIYTVISGLGIYYRIGYGFAFVCSGVLIFFCSIMSKRTEYGTRILGRILGFKNFLEFAEKSRLEALVSENPEYFYEILPYAYVLDVSDTWMKKFESIVVEPPGWYSGYHSHGFNMVSFHHFMNNTMTSVHSTMTSQPHSSGGGVSGGGSGGGGGGSW